MKAMKKITVLLLIAALMASAAIPALAAFESAYDNKTAKITADTEVPHNMEITESPYTLPHTITYTYAIDGNVEVVYPTSGLTADKAVVNAPTFKSGNDSVSYNQNDNFAAATNHTITKNVKIDWGTGTGAVEFKEPGIYRWKVKKTVNYTTATQSDVTNKPAASAVDATAYLYVYVIEKADGSLEAHPMMSYADAAPAAGNKTITDQYPVDTLDLNLSKTVAGSMGTKDQYFEFTIVLNLPTNAAEQNYTITGLDDTATVQGSPYSNSAAAEQPADQDSTMNGIQVKLKGGANTIKVWLKHGQTATIKDLPYGTKYKITETEITGSGYTTSYQVTVGTNTPVDGTGREVDKTSSTTGMTQTETVAFTNTKNETPPTGILLQVGAPLTGLVLAAALLSVILATKRRKEQETK
jgi:hypothetical protein